MAAEMIKKQPFVTVGSYCTNETGGIYTNETGGNSITSSLKSKIEEVKNLFKNTPLRYRIEFHRDEDEYGLVRLTIDQEHALVDQNKDEYKDILHRLFKLDESLVVTIDSIKPSEDGDPRRTELVFFVGQKISPRTQETKRISSKLVFDHLHKKGQTLRGDLERLNVRYPLVGGFYEPNIDGGEPLFIQERKNKCMILLHIDPCSWFDYLKNDLKIDANMIGWEWYNDQTHEHMYAHGHLYIDHENVPEEHALLEFAKRPRHWAGESLDWENFYETDRKRLFRDRLNQATLFQLRKDMAATKEDLYDAFLEVRKDVVKRRKYDFEDSLATKADLADSLLELRKDIKTDLADAFLELRKGWDEKFQKIFDFMEDVLQNKVAKADHIKCK